jgi:hypothetical protein
MILNAINNKKIPFKTVLMDSWYATQRLMGLIDNDRKISGLTQRHLCKCKYRIRIIKNTPQIEAIRKS